MEKMNMRKWFFFLSLFFALGVDAQTLHIKGTYAAGNVDALDLSITPIGSSETPKGTKFQANDKVIEGDVEVSETGFYMVYGRMGNEMQLMSPMYVAPETKVCKPKLYLEDKMLCVNLGKDNKALCAYNQVIAEKDRFFWMKGKNLQKENLLSFLKSYQQTADSIVEKTRCSEPVKQYLNLWAYTSAIGIYEAIPRVLNLNKKDLPFTKAELFADPHKLLDTQLAACFPSVFHMIMEGLPKGMEESLSALYANYSTDVIRKKVAEMIVDNYVRRYNYSHEYEQGLARLNEAIDKYGLDAKYIEEFAKRRSSVKGSVFPTVELKDAEGNKMDFSSFKGYYVYIDLWASWCGPCCKEVPYLQALEKELKNENVKFLSISLDKDEAAWKAKMKELNMHGNQWIDPADMLGNALNVRGIPRFLIYDKEGNMYNGNAPRPSSSEIRGLLENLK